MKHPVAGLHKECSIDYVDVRFDIQLLMLVHKHLYLEVNSTKPTGLLLKQNNTVGRVTRSANKMELIYPSDSKISYSKTPLYRAVDLWNSLAYTCRLTSDKTVFNPFHAVSQYIAQNCIQLQDIQW